MGQWSDYLCERWRSADAGSINNLVSLLNRLVVNKKRNFYLKGIALFLPTLNRYINLRLSRLLIFTTHEAIDYPGRAN